MAGYMYLGNKKVCPAIVVKSGYNTKNAYFMENVFTSVDANGKLTADTTTTGDLVFTGFKDVGDYLLTLKFQRDTSITSVLFNDLEKITGTLACDSMFYRCTNIQSASFPKLKEVNGYFAGNAMFNKCTNLVSAFFQKLSVIADDQPLDRIFDSCERLESVYFPSLTTSSFDSLEDGYLDIFTGGTASTSGNVTVHFPSNLQSTVEGLDSYPNFGGKSGYVTLAFDLPATS